MGRSLEKGLPPLQLITTGFASLVTHREMPHPAVKGTYSSSLNSCFQARLHPNSAERKRVGGNAIAWSRLLCGAANEQGWCTQEAKLPRSYVKEEFCQRAEGTGLCCVECHKPIMRGCPLRLHCSIPSQWVALLKQRPGPSENLPPRLSAFSRESCLFPVGCQPERLLFPPSFTPHESNISSLRPT